MGNHNDCVASALLCRTDNRLVGVVVFNMHPSAGYTGRRSGIVRCLEMFRGKSGNTSFLLLWRVGDHARFHRENVKRLRDLGIESLC